jgi:hypothetical protein
VSATTTDAPAVGGWLALICARAQSFTAAWACRRRVTAERRAAVSAERRAERLAEQAHGLDRERRVDAVLDGRDEPVTSNGDRSVEEVHAVRRRAEAARAAENHATRAVVEVLAGDEGRAVFDDLLASRRELVAELSGHVQAVAALWRRIEEHDRALAVVLAARQGRLDPHPKSRLVGKLGGAELNPDRLADVVGRAVELPSEIACPQ